MNGHHGFIASTIVLGAMPFALFVMAWWWYRRTVAAHGAPPPDPGKDPL